MKRKPNSRRISKAKIIFDLFFLLLAIVVYLFALCYLFLSIRTGESLKNPIIFLAAYTCFIVITFIHAHNMASNDYMCMVPNIIKFTNHAGRLQFQKKLSQFTAAYVNISSVKYFNKKYGNSGGDQIIIKFSAAVKSSLQKGESMARLGGDNFIVLLKDENVSDFIDRLSRMKVQIDYNGNAKIVLVESRMGLYSLQPEDSISDLMNKTSIAFNNTKEQGKNVVWFDPEMHQKIIHEKEIVNSFDAALANEEFIVYYQPKYNMQNGTLIGAEALVRWIQKGNIIPPDDFIPVLEREGLVTQLDFYVFERVCKDIRRWKDFGKHPVRISSNFSRIHMRDKYFGDKIVDILNEYNIDSKLIEIEITESASYEDFEALKHFVEYMNRMQITVSIDDFGTAYSSLSMIKNLPVNVVKLDKSFLINLSDDTNKNFLFIKNLVHLITDLNCEVICEGVETENHKKLLMEAGCMAAQGFLYSKPIQIDEFEEKL